MRVAGIVSFHTGHILSDPVFAGEDERHLAEPT